MDFHQVETPNTEYSAHNGRQLYRFIDLKAAMDDAKRDIKLEHLTSELMGSSSAGYEAACLMDVRKSV